MLHSFAGEYTDGADPMAALLDVNGTLYGTAEFNGKNGAGTVLKLTL